MDRWRKGALKRLCVYNWMTFEGPQEFVFHPGMNFVCAANGSGKSALVCAIALGLGFKLSVLGRAKSIDKLICRKKTIAFIDIELAAEDLSNKSIKVRRDMNVSNGTVHSEWSINGHKVTLREIELLHRDFNLQVDSSVSFLPQDRVSEFASLGSRALLESILLAVSAEHANTLRSLSQIESSQNIYNQELKAYKQTEETLAAEEQKYSTFHQAKQWTEEIELLDKKIAILRKEECESKLNQCIKQQCQRNKNQIEEFQKDINDFENQIRCLEDDVKDKEKQNNVIEIEIDNLESKKQDWKDQLDQILEAITEVETKEQQLRPSNEHHAKIKEFENCLRKKQIIRDELSDSHMKSTIRKNQLDEDINKLRRQKEQMLSLNSRRLRFLLDGIRNRLQRSNIEAAIKRFNIPTSLPDDSVSLPPILGPLAAYIDVASECSGILHKCLRFRILSFVVSGPQAPIYAKELSQMDISVLKLPERKQLYFEVTPELKNVGVVAFLHEKVSHPSLRDLLSLYCKINTIAIVKPTSTPLNDLDHCQIVDALKTSLARQTNLGPPLTIKYLIGNDLHTVESSIYNRNCRYSSSELVPKSILFGSIPSGASKDHLIEVEAYLSKLEKEVKHVTEEIIFKEKEQRDIQGSCEEVLKQLRTLRDFTRQYNVTKKQLEQSRARLKIHQNNKPNVDQDRKNYKHRMDQNMKLVKLHGKKIEQLNRKVEELEQKKNKMTQNDDVFEAQLRELEEKLTSFSSEMNSISSQFYQTRSRYKNLQDTLEEAKKVLQKLVITPEDRKQMAALEGNIGDLENERDNKRVKRDAITRNAAPAQEYERVITSLRSVRENIINHEKAITEQKEQLTIRGNQFNSTMDSLIRQINQRFQLFMSQMNPNYRGRLVQITNNDGGNELFSQYGLSLEVRYREGDPFKPLTTAYQSGGEKSCAAMVLILALQGISTAPFRVIDEINQGLDCHNETQMMSLVNEIANKGHEVDSSRNSKLMTKHSPLSQYIILTPQVIRGVAKARFNVVWTASRPHHEVDVEKDEDSDEDAEDSDENEEEDDTLFTPSYSHKRTRSMTEASLKVITTKRKRNVCLFRNNNDIDKK